MDWIRFNFIKPLLTGVCNLWFMVQIVFLFLFEVIRAVRTNSGTKFVDDNVVKIKLYSTQHGNSGVATIATATAILYYYDQNKHTNNNNKSSKIEMKADIFVDISQPLEHSEHTMVLVGFVWKYFILYACI